jgi:two-component system, cell cycle response regulator
MAIRILIIEDHAPNLELMTYLLTAFGHTALEAGDGMSGLEMAGRERPDLIICDIQLPDINGYEIASRLKRDVGMRDIPLVAITALAMVGERERALQAGFDGYISKPITPETFVAEVESFLSVKQPARKGNPATAVPNREVEAQQPRQELVAWRATILVVDNVPSNLELARSIFEPSGYRVILADDVEEAMALAKQTRPDLVLSDVNMPEASGLELVLRIKSDPKLASVPVILISATLPRDTRDDLVLATGAIRFLRRPIDPIVLLTEIESCLEMSRQAHA